MEEEKGLVKKILFTKIKSSSVECYKKLENEGFGMLADKDNSERIDDSHSIVCPDGSILTPKQIRDYWNKRAGYSSSNPLDVKMHNARMYYLGFKGKIVL